MAITYSVNNIFKKVYDKPLPFDEVYPIVSFDYAQDDDGTQGDVPRHGERSRTMTRIGHFKLGQCHVQIAIDY